ncbi:Phosphoinositide phospholipase C 2 [Forsythia ovata]|uniref:Phosphoinositide phospholipase C n=1 Tax=Forsythia ovata TaxID=205694 RepID=A0ABD1X1H6_9LAMI
MSKQSYKVCFCFRRRFRLAAAEAPEDIKALFNQYSENEVMSLDQLHRFLIEVQKEENATLEDAQAVMGSLHEFKHLNMFHLKGLNIESFFKYLFGDVNPPINPKLGVHHDMTAPLSNYFIFTGHNSYLTGNQLSSDCSDVPIIHALRRGVRVIELDIWPNSKKDNVNVLHGRTLTNPVELVRCLRSIKEHAFFASEYPVVITLEDHLTPDLQAKVAEMITQTFGDMLFSPGSECLKEFPSPESLKKKIIISTKPPKEYLEAKEVKARENGSKKGKEEEAWGKEVNFKAKIDDEKDDDLEEREGDNNDEDDSKLHQNTAPEYKRLIAIHAGKGKGSISDWLRVDPNKVRRISLSEQELEKAVISHGKDIVRFTQRNVLRVYPKGTRFNSSNYNPLVGWMHGAQMVAFNMQGYGRSLWLMHGMFRANGGCGYVKKPDFLVKAGPHNEVFDPKVKFPVKTTLRVTVYMGEGWYYDFRHTHFDTYSPPDFYTRVGIAGVPADTIMKKTRILEDNWIPNWDETFDFPLTVPELALLRIEVHEYDMSEKDDFAGQTCLPVSELRKGIRAVPLHTRKGDKYKSVKLLMRFEFV